MQQLNIEISGGCTRLGCTGVDLVKILGENIQLAGEAISHTISHWCYGLSDRFIICDKIRLS
jgi:hypothetical protein